MDTLPSKRDMKLYNIKRKFGEIYLQDTILREPRRFIVRTLAYFLVDSSGQAPAARAAAKRGKILMARFPDNESVRKRADEVTTIKYYIFCTHQSVEKILIFFFSTPTIIIIIVQKNVVSNACVCLKYYINNRGIYAKSNELI